MDDEERDRILRELDERIECNAMDVGNDLSIREPMVFVPRRLLLMIQKLIQGEQHDQVGGTE